MLSGQQKSGGLSGEHIELCAEGARQKPNLSGKRTETRINGPVAMRCSCSSPPKDCCFIFRKKVLFYVRKTP